jgi:dipeptidyl aminopeptidase/acylaminoacyl peptidase
MKRTIVFAAIAVFVSLSASSTRAQGTMADYDRALKLREEYVSRAINVPERANWIGSSHHFWYRKSVRSGNEFVWVDAETQQKRPAFDHEKLAASLSSAASATYTALNLPFPSITFVDNEKAIEFQILENRWRCELADYSCKQRPDPFGFRRGGTANGIPGPRYNFPAETKVSPDGKMEALINNYNVFVGQKGKHDATPITFDGSEGNYYALASVTWSPDSTKIAAYRVRPGYNRRIQYVQSSPADQVQPKYSSIDYAKPGDELDQPQPVLIDVVKRKQYSVNDALFPNPYSLSRIEWRKDSRAFSFEYNQRGHQVYRVIEVEAATGSPRAVISEEPKTFFCYSGKRYRFDVSDGKEVVWMSERDGWNHLYLFDGVSGKLRNQITRGEWVVREVVKVDEQKRQIWFQASGMYPGKDPYFTHYYRINFDGTGLVTLTTSDANHFVAFSEDMKFMVDSYSRVDLPTMSELKSIEDNKLLSQLETPDISELQKAGWRPPEVFVSTARDGKTDIWGVIYRPSNFDPLKKYAVVENIYAGPQGSFVPKTFTPFNPMQALAEIGFIVVQIDGMGTANRSKAFHDYAWKNLGDAGFPDRILWHKAVAAKYPYYDITRVGIYGNSAGGQNSLGGMLFHPEFYKVCVSSCGCHDNRMDKIWWNEQWMGWPLGPEYAAASNVDHASKLRGKLLLVLGEMDTNVDPASTMQVVNALIKAEKTFDLLVIPNAGHGSGGVYGDKKRYDFFVHHLLGLEPPDWNTMKKQDPAAGSSSGQ